MITKISEAFVSCKIAKKSMMYIPGCKNFKQGKSCLLFNIIIDGDTPPKTHKIKAFGESADALATYAGHNI